MELIDSIISLCEKQESTNPIDILEALMSEGLSRMHGPEHHMFVGASLLTAFANSGGKFQDGACLADTLRTLASRVKDVPGAVCGHWGVCGAVISAGVFESIVTKSGPLEGKTWAIPMELTSEIIKKQAAIGGPRCCKRDSYIAVSEAIKFTNDYLGVSMTSPNEIHCTRSSQNQQCIRERCPFYRKRVAFVCVHNSCRSQIAEAFARKYYGERYDIYSAGTELKPQINQDAVRLMKDHYDIDMSNQHSKLLSSIPSPDLVVTMGCNVACPVIPGASKTDFGIEDPTDKTDDEFLRTIEEIKQKVDSLLGGTQQ